MNGNKNNKLLYDPEEIRRKRLEELNRNQYSDEDEEDIDATSKNELEENVDSEDTNESNLDETTGDFKESEDDNGELENEGSSRGSRLSNIVSFFRNRNSKKETSGVAEISGLSIWNSIKLLVKSNPTIIFFAICIILFLFVILILLLSLSSEEVNNNNNSYIGLYGYEYLEFDNVCEEVYVYNTNSGSDGTYPLEEYVAGVVQAEVGMMNDLTTYEVFAIAARTYALNRLQNSDDCSIEGNDYAQAFRPTEDELILQATQNTRGLVLTRDGSLFSTMYDAFCWTEKDDNYYYMCQGNYDTGEPLEIPVAWANEHVAQWSGQAFLDNPEYMSHGQGMSQHGVYYLSASEGYTRDEIFTYFYGSDSKLMSIYATFGGEYPINPNDELYQNLQFIADGTTYANVLNSYSTTKEEMDAYLAGIVSEYGEGTREAVVNVAVGLIGSLANMGYKLNYQWGGKYDYVGTNAVWGEPASTNCNHYASQGYDINKCLKNYQWSGFDCSGFVNWAIINGFGSKYNSGMYQATELSNTIPLNATTAVCAPGDVLVSTGHIMLVVGIDTASSMYIVAESTGADLSNGTGGVKLSYKKFNESPYSCRRLDSYYNSASEG